MYTNKYVKMLKVNPKNSEILLIKEALYDNWNIQTVFF